MEIEIVTVGNEILLGETVDTNSAHIARRLAGVGLRVARITAVGDDRVRLAEALRGVRGRVRWAITTGGLGPTRDDLTRNVVAEVFDRPLEEDPRQLEIVREKFRRFGYETMPESNRSQAMVPRGARVIDNRHGTAPGLVIEEDDLTLFVLPGVPREMAGLLEEAVLPALTGAAGQGEPVVASRVVHTAGLGESALAERIDDLVDGAGAIEVAFLPHLGQVDMRLTAAGLPLGEATMRLDELAGRIAERLARWFYGYDDATLAGAVGEALSARGWTVAVAESCTAGELGAEITSVAGSSVWFTGGVMAYSNRVKETVLAVPGETLERFGAVSFETVRLMAAGVRRALGADVGCAITGIAGPGGGSAEKPVGLVWCAVETPGGLFVTRLNHPGGRADVRRRAVLATMGLMLGAVRGDLSPEAA